MQDEGHRLLAAEAAVEADQFLERRPFVRVRVEEAVDEDVGSVDERTRAPEVIGTVRTEVGEGVLTLDAIVDQIADARAADGERPELLGMHEHEADPRMLGQSGEQTGVARAERLERGASVDLR